MVRSINQILGKYGQIKLKDSGFNNFGKIIKQNNKYYVVHTDKNFNGDIPADALANKYYWSFSDSATLSFNSDKIIFIKANKNYELW